MLGENFTLEELQEVIKDADLDGNEEISYDEFVKIMKSLWYLQLAKWKGMILYSLVNNKWYKCHSIYYILHILFIYPLYSLLYI